MRYRELVVLVFAYGLITPAFAEICCPNGCSQDANRCVYNGTQNTCPQSPQSTCGGSSGGSSGGANPPGTPQVTSPNIGGRDCVWLNPTKASLDAATNKCVSDLSKSAQVFGCFFEDDAGRAEDERTGLSCPARQAALANQCRSRCVSFASYSTNCKDANDVWHDYFGDISGDIVGSARVDLCGPKLRASLFSRTMLLRPRPYMP
jgi:hypothetical protein